MGYDQTPQIMLNTTQNKEMIVLSKDFCPVRFSLTKNTKRQNLLFVCYYVKPSPWGETVNAWEKMSC